MSRFNVGEVFIDVINIGGVDVKENLYKASFDETLFVPGIRGVVQIVQAQGMETLLGNSIGSTPATVVFGSEYGMKRIYQMTVSMSGAQPLVNQKSRIITFELVSDHLLRGMGTNYQKSYQQSPTQISNMVSAILSDSSQGLGFKGKTNISKTIGMSAMLLHSQSPLQHIDMLRNYAVSSTQGDAFTFFSSIGSSGKEEMSFKPMSELLQQMSNITITEKDFMQINHSLDPMAELFRNVIDYKTENTSDSSNKGQAVYQANFFDMLTGKYVINPLMNLISQQSKNPSANPGKTRNQNPDGKLSGPKGSSNRTFFKSKDKPDTQMDMTYGGGRSVLGADMSSTTHAKIPGDSDICVGICINYQKKENMQTTFSLDGMNAGKQLVAGVSHEIDEPTAKPRYTTTISMMNISPKGGFS